MVKIIQGIMMLVLMLVVAVVMAQEVTYTPECSDGLGTMHDEVASYMKRLDAADAESDIASWMTTAHEMRFFLAAMDGICRGYHWSSEVDGLQPVIGPVMFQDGLYRVTVITEGFYILEVEAIEGDCETRRSDTIFNLSSGEGSDGAQSTFDATGCTALFAASNVSDEWELSFELISAGQ